MSISAKEIYDILSDNNIPVIEIRRFTRKEGDIFVPSPTVYFSVASAAPLETVILYYQRYRCERYIPRPRQCGRCLSFGHTVQSCRGRRKCIKCGADHESANCDTEYRGCVLCGGDHKADSPHCPDYQREARILKQCTTRRCSYQDAKRSQSGQPTSYAKVASLPKPKQNESASRQPPRQEQKYTRVPLKPTDDFPTLTKRISQLESTVEALRAEICHLHEILRSYPTIPDQEVYISEREPSTDKPMAAPLPFKRPSQQSGSTAQPSHPKKKKGPKPRQAAASATSDTDGPQSDIDLPYPAGPSRATTLYDLDITSPAEQAKIHRHQSKTQPTNV
ncbi:uncharacterized protein [Centruroides vittatus]|uniref:uncharacterized protein n=1 Tax=Centruroides vittatus TaxID=120091 RepID=UPI0035105D8F